MTRAGAVLGSAIFLVVAPGTVAVYRHVRNPMYVGVSSLILGQGLLFGNVPVLEYGFVVWLVFFAFVLFYEEPALRRKFGKQYEEFCIRVPARFPASNRAELGSVRAAST